MLNKKPKVHKKERPNLKQQSSDRDGGSYSKVGGRLIHEWTTPLTNRARTCNSINHTKHGE